MSSMSWSAWAHPQAEMLRGLAAQDVIDDREVVGREVPDHVDVVLEQPEVDPDAVDVVEISQLSRLRRSP